VEKNQEEKERKKERKKEESSWVRVKGDEK
jgi:hypothetical protein